MEQCRPRADAAHDRRRRHRCAIEFPARRVRVLGTTVKPLTINYAWVGACQRNIRLHVLQFPVGQTDCDDNADTLSAIVRCRVAAVQSAAGVTVPRLPTNTRCEASWNFTLSTGWPGCLQALTPQCTQGGTSVAAMPSPCTWRTGGPPDALRLKGCRAGQQKMCRSSAGTRLLWPSNDERPCVTWVSSHAGRLTT